MNELQENHIILLVAIPLETQKKTEKYIKTIYTGVGKVNAAIKATEVILKYKPKRIINYGTAGSHIYQHHELIDCTKFIQRDMHIKSLGFGEYETPFDKDSSIPVEITFNSTDNKIGKNATCYSGDSFVQDKSRGYEIVDMEAYAIAKACYFYDVDFISYKYITDGADGDSSNDWLDNSKIGVDKFISLMWD